MPPLPYKRKASYSQSWKPNYSLTPLQKKQVLLISNRSARRKQEVKRTVNSGGVNLLAGQAAVWNPFYNIAQGTGSGNRVGAHINCDSIDVSLLLETSSATNKEMSVFVFAYWAEEVTFTSSTTPTTVPVANLQSDLPLLGATTTGNVTNQVFDVNQCKSIRESRFVIPLSLTGVAGAKHMKLRIPMKSKHLTYNSDSASFFQGKNLIIGVISDCQGATSGTTPTVTVWQTTTVNFRE